MIYEANGIGELIYLTIIPPNLQENPEESIRAAYSELGVFLQSNQAELLHERIYGRLSSAQSILQIRQEVLTQEEENTLILPTLVEGISNKDTVLIGIHAIAARKSPIHSISFLERNHAAYGSYFRGHEAEYVFLTDIGRMLANSERLNPADEAYETIRLADEILQELRWSYRNVLRTWFYLDDILGWYPHFNRVRNDLYKRLGLLNGNPKILIPASTGIRGRNARGNWCTLDLLAMRPLEGHHFQTRRLVNPKQNEATEYGSAFSRGLSVTTDSCTTVFISGTASIDERGTSIYPGDMERQTERTLLNVESLIQSAGAQMDRIIQATAFVKYPQDVPVFERLVQRMGLTHVPIVCTVADVCRDDLLFELDATAVIPA